MKKQPLPASSQPIYIGVDFAKEKFDYHGPDLKGSLPNEPAAHRPFLALLPPGAQLVCESTGSCHRALVQTAHAKGWSVTVVNPRQVRDFIKGLGGRAKSDPIDAFYLHEFGRLVRPCADVPPSAATLALRELVVARQQAVLERSTLLLQQADQSVPALRTLTKARLQRLTKDIEKLEQLILQTMAQEPVLAAKAARLAEVKGVGPVTAATCVALFPELGTLSRGEAAALLGVAPYDDDSGKLHKPRHIAGGRFRLRSALYMAALSATRCNPILRRFFQHLRAQKKPSKVALTAVMRKLIVLLNHLLRKPDFQLSST